MNKTGLLIAIILFFYSGSIFPQEYYWIGFTDKKGSPFSIDNPEDYLSERAIQRRIRQNISIDSLDLPVTPEYIGKILETGVTLVHSSKWLNGITVKATSNNFKSAVLAFPFVREVQLTKPVVVNKSAVSKYAEPNAWSDNIPIDTSCYGASVYQTGLLNGQYLHQLGIKGEGIQIAVLDGGFYKADVYPAFDSLWMNDRILGMRDFANPADAFFQTDYHGMSVLSCMGGNIPGELIGTATEASYWLIRSEDTGLEYINEEDNWAVAAEFADSVGADIINSSVGYFVFQDSSTSHTYADMDGKTTRVTIAANIAFTRGMLVFSSAGNEGDNTWKYIIAPSDGDNVIGVGAVNKFGFPPDFTSSGPASDGDVKPNLAAVGWNTYLVVKNGNFGYSSGTSYASPVLAGLAACLWQANPQATASEMKDALERSGHLYDTPDSLLGFGVPDMKIAHSLLNPDTAEIVQKKSGWKVYPNPVREQLVIQQLSAGFNKNVLISLFSVDGRLLRKEQRAISSQIMLNNLQALPSGLLILKLESGNNSETFKINKIR